jgi:hypothetical protein
LVNTPVISTARPFGLTVMFQIRGACDETLA